MPLASEHIALADSNGLALEHMRSAPAPGFPGWVVIIAFYEAIHRIEAIFAAENILPRPTTHVEREDLLKRDKSFQPIYGYYKELQNASEIARYMKFGAAHFDSFLSRPNLEALALSTWLHGIRRYSEIRITGKGTYTQAKPGK